MGNYSMNAGLCRVDLFKPSGKWYITLAIDLTDSYGRPDLQQALREAIQKEHGHSYSEMQAVCLEPYSKFEHPISIILGEVEE